MGILKYTVEISIKQTVERRLRCGFQK